MTLSIDFTDSSAISDTMTTPHRQRRSIGRPRATAASAHEAIIDAVYELLQVRSVRDLTMEEIAKRAGVGKPTLYKWWSSKAALVLTMLRERVTPALDAPEAGSLEE